MSPCSRTPFFKKKKKTKTLIIESTTQSNTFNFSVSKEKLVTNHAPTQVVYHTGPMYILKT